MASRDSPPEGPPDVAALGDGSFLDRAFFESLVENGSDAIVTIDEDSTVVYANRAVERVFGYAPEDLVGEPLTTIMPERFHDAHLESIERYLRTGDRNLDWNDIQLPAAHADGHEVQLDITFEEHRYEGERVFSGIMRDVTDRVERTRELERQNERLERFASIVSHDLRDPLQGAKATVALARAREDDEELLAELEDTLDGMEDLIADVLTLAKQGRTVDDPSRVALSRVVADAWETADTGAATLETGDLPEVEADPDRLRELLTNLFRNAVEHGGPDVTVRVDPVDGDRGFVVADDGPGFGGADPDRLFEYGYSGSESGTGFGLSIVADIAEAHGWTVTAEEADDGGARFVLAFGGERA
ncbi:MAG: nitrogen regulation protein NR(II) [Haloferacaceae archaeon]